MAIRKRIEAGFAEWGHFVVRFRWTAIAVCLALSAALGAQTPRIEVDNSSEAFLHPEDPTRIQFDAFRAQFGTDDRIMVVLRPPKVFDLDFLAVLRDIHGEIEGGVPYIEEVTSLLNARLTRGDENRLIVEDLMAKWPETESDLALLRERALSNPLLVNSLVTETGHLTAISIKPFTYSTLHDEDDALEGFDETTESDDLPAYLSAAEGRDLTEALMAILDRHRSPELEIHAIGGAVIDYSLTKVMDRDMGTSFALALLVITAVLFILFRRASGVILPLFVVVASVIATSGVMVLFDIPYSITLNILPAFLIVVGICDSIHILVIVYQRLAAGDAREAAIPYALGHSGLAVLMTSLTTAAGLFSFSTAELAPVAHLGIVAPIGVLIAMGYSLILLPALLAVIPLRSVSQSETPRVAAVTDRFLSGIGDFSTRYPHQVLGIALAIVVVGAFGVEQVRFSHDGIRWFPPDDPVRVASDIVDSEFGGGGSLEILLDTGQVNGLHDPDLLRRMERAGIESRQLRVDGHPVSQTLSIVDILKETHQALNENDPAFYGIPDDRVLVAQELLLFENSGSDDLEDVTNSQLQLARISVRTPWADAMLYPAFVEQADTLFRRILGEDLEIELTGGAVLFTGVFHAVILSMSRSYVIAILIITPMLVVLVGNLRLGLAAMLPNLFPLYVALAAMGFWNIPLDASTLLIGGTLLGIAVDDTIHFMHKFNSYLADLGDVRAAVHATLATTGSALLFTSLVLSLGFGVFMSSYLLNVFWFGLLISMSTVVAFFADILIGPALMVVLAKPPERG